MTAKIARSRSVTRPPHGSTTAAMKATKGRTTTAPTVILRSSVLMDSHGMSMRRMSRTRETQYHGDFLSPE